MSKSEKENTDTLQENIAEILEQMREISSGLYPFYIEKTGLKSAIEEFAFKTEKATGLLFITKIDEIDSLLSAENKNHVFRIVQECVTNTIRHANATGIKLSLLVLKNNLK